MALSQRRSVIMWSWHHCASVSEPHTTLYLCLSGVEWCRSVTPYYKSDSFNITHNIHVWKLCWHHTDTINPVHAITKQFGLVLGRAGHDDRNAFHWEQPGEGIIQYVPTHFTTYLVTDSSRHADCCGWNPLNTVLQVSLYSTSSMKPKLLTWSWLTSSDPEHPDMMLRVILNWN